MARQPGKAKAGGSKAGGSKAGGSKAGDSKAAGGGSRGTAASDRKAAEALADPVDTALRLAGQVGWDGVTLSDIAAAAGMKLSELFPRYPSKAALVAAHMARTDAAMLDAASADGAGEPLQDRLFDVIMARFDALQAQRDGVLAIARAAGRDPLSGLCLAVGPLRRAVDAILVAAGLSGDGLSGAMRRKAVGAIYLAAFRTWSRDDSADMAATMAALDRLLTRWLPMLERLERGWRRPASAATAATNGAD